MRLPDQMLVIFRALRTIGRPRLVGGGVRDWLLGLEPKDLDIEVAGADYESLVRRPGWTQFWRRQAAARRR
jgi:tRNA nucleotidyltransferase (CCA-adding enzyme)